MKTTREDIEQFDAYLSGVMDKEERLLFESRLATDDELNREFEVHAMIVEGIAAEKEDRLRAVLRQQRRDTFIGGNVWGKRFTTASAAVVLIGMIALIYANYREKSLIVPVANHTEDVEEQRGESRDKYEPVKEKDSVFLRDRNNESEGIDIEEQEVQPPVPDGEMVEMDEPKLDADMEERFAVDGDDMDDSKVVLTDKKPQAVFDVGSSSGSISSDVMISRETINVTSVFSAAPTLVQKKSMESTATLAEVTVGRNIGSSKEKRYRRKKADKRKTEAPAPSDYDSTLQLRREDKEVIQKDSLANTSKDNSAEEKDRITIEYYKSPLNYKGYRYDVYTKKLIVYGLKRTNSKLYRYNNQLYMKNKGDVYLIQATQIYTKFARVEDKQLIEKLKKK